MRHAGTVGEEYLDVITTGNGGDRFDGGGPWRDRSDLGGSIRCLRSTGIRTGSCIPILALPRRCHRAGARSGT